MNQQTPIQLSIFWRKLQTSTKEMEDLGELESYHFPRFSPRFHRFTKTAMLRNVGLPFSNKHTAAQRHHQHCPAIARDSRSTRRCDPFEQMDQPPDVSLQRQVQRQPLPRLGWWKSAKRYEVITCLENAFFSM